MTLTDSLMGFSKRKSNKARSYFSPKVGEGPYTSGAPGLPGQGRDAGIPGATSGGAESGLADALVQAQSGSDLPRFEMPVDPNSTYTLPIPDSPLLGDKNLTFDAFTGTPTHVDGQEVAFGYSSYEQGEGRNPTPENKYTGDPNAPGGPLAESILKSIQNITLPGSLSQQAGQSSKETSAFAGLDDDENVVSLIDESGRSRRAVRRNGQYIYEDSGKPVSGYAGI